LNNREVVIKKIKKSEDEEKFFNREIEIMQEMKDCKYSCHYYDHYSDNDYYYIIMEKCDGDLKNLLDQNKNGFSESTIKNILLQLNEAFKMMKEKNIIHRALKPENIFIKYNSKDSNDFNIKLGNFRQYENKNFTAEKGTVGYEAPEQDTPNYDPSKCNLWSIGVIIYVLKFKELPYMSFYSGKIPNQFDNKFLDDLVHKLIVIDPKKRINWEDYFSHPFFK
jgi:serine/threonine protein kinase